MYSSILRHSALGLMSLLASLIVRKARGQDFATKFYRAINLNGPAVVIDGQQWEAGDAVDIEFQAAGVENQTVPLQPSTDTSRAMMIRSSRWGRNFSLAMRNIPPGDYQVFAYVWEDNNSEQYSIELNVKTVVAQYASGAAETWN